jgi:hypothetical protein
MSLQLTNITDLSIFNDQNLVGSDYLLKRERERERDAIWRLRARNITIIN